MSHFKDVCPFCNVVLRQCRCIGEKAVKWKVCAACVRAGFDQGFDPGFSPCEANPTPSPNTSDAQAFRNLCRDVFTIFDIARDTPLPKAMKLIQDFRVRYNEKDAKYMHLMAVCEEALGKEGAFEATDAAARIEKLLEENKTLKNTCEVYEHAVRKLKEDLDRAQERIKHLNDHLDVKDAEIRRLAENLDKEKGCHETCETVRGFLNSDIATLRDMLSNRGAFMAELRNALSEPTCDLTHLLNRVKGEVEVNRNIAKKLQAALGLKDEEVSSHYDLADDVCDRVEKYDSLRAELLRVLNLAAASDDGIVANVERKHAFRVEVETRLGSHGLNNLGLLRALDLRLATPTPEAPIPEAPIPFAKALERLINRYFLEQESHTPDYILAEYMDKCRMAFDAGVSARDKWYGVSLRPGCSTDAPQVPSESRPYFEEALEKLLTRYEVNSDESVVKTEDFLLSQYIRSNLCAYQNAKAKGRIPVPPPPTSMPQEAKPWKPEGPGWQGALPKPGPLSLDKPDCPISGPRTWRAGNKVAPEDIQVGMKFQSDREMAGVPVPWKVEYFRGDVVFVILDLGVTPPAQFTPAGSFSRYYLSQVPLAEDFTEGE